MGGWGSGRRGGYDTTEGYRRLDVRKLQRESVLNRRYSFNWQWLRKNEVIGFISIRPADDRITLSYKHRTGGHGEWTPVEYEVEIERTRCHFGGERVWFRCPAVSCKRRVAILYGLYGAKYFVCRQCYRLAYPSQRLTRSDRATNRAYALRERACGWGTIFEPLFRRKGMHRKTFARIAREYYRQVRVAISDFPGELASLEEFIDFEAWMKRST
jgi:hypothetical protein